MSELARKSLLADLKAAGPRQAVGEVVRYGVPDGDREIITGPVSGRVALLEAHDWGRRPVGIAEVRSEPGRAVGHFKWLDTHEGRESGETSKQLDDAGVRQPLSIGFRVIKARPASAAEHELGAVRVLEQIELVEVSLVLLGAIPTAEISSVKCTACTAKQRPSRAEIDSIVAEGERVLAQGAKLLAPLPETSEQRIAAARQELGLLPEVQVDYERRAWAERVVALAAQRWGVHPPTVRWTNRKSIAGWRGVFYVGTDAVWLSSALQDPAEIASVAIHETCHHARAVRGLPNNETEVALDTTSLMKIFYNEGL